MMKLAGIVVALCVTLAGCEQPSTAKSPSDLPGIIGSQIASDAKQVSIGELTSFDWEYLHVFAPYEPRGSVCKVLERYDSRCTSIGDLSFDDGGVFLLVFVGRDRIVGTVKHGRNNGTFKISEYARFHRSNAIFVVSEDKQVNYSRTKWFLLTPKRL